MEKIKNNKIILIVALIVVVIVVLMLTKNNMTPEETISRFMYLVENKNYDEAKKLCIGNIEKLDILSNIKPSNLNFDFSEDKKSAKTILLEDQETAEVTTMYVNLDKTFFGWKIKEYNVITDLIEQAVVQERLESNETVSDSQFICWALSEETKIEDISKYAENNLIVLLIFSELMKNQEYEKAMQLYNPIDLEPYQGEELNEDEIKEFDWSDYFISNNVELFEMNVYMLSSYDEEINIMIGADHVICHIYKSNI